jgi:hypothetical protein
LNLQRSQAASCRSLTTTCWVVSWRHLIQVGVGVVEQQQVVVRSLLVLHLAFFKLKAIFCRYGWCGLLRIPLTAIVYLYDIILSSYPPHFRWLSASVGSAHTNEKIRRYWSAPLVSSETLAFLQRYVRGSWAKHKSCVCKRLPVSDGFCINFPIGSLRCKLDTSAPIPDYSGSMVLIKHYLLMMR